jgi:hypothetical protein
LTIVLVIIGCNDSTKDKEKQLAKNVAIFFYDNSLNMENSSIQLLIDHKPIFQSDSINKSKSQDFDVNLDIGKLIILVRTKDGTINTMDTISINKINQRYLLSIAFSYNPPLDWYKDYSMKELYKKVLIQNKLRLDTTIKWLMDSLKNEIEQEDKITPYKPNDRHFEIQFTEQAILE